MDSKILMFLPKPLKFTNIGIIALLHCATKINCFNKYKKNSGEYESGAKIALWKSTS